MNIESSVPVAITITDDSSKLHVDCVQKLLKQTFWAVDRTQETIQKSLKNSLCFGLFCGDKQVAFARVVTDKCTFAYLCDVVVDENYRGRGYSTRLMDRIMKHPDLQQFRRFMLATRDAHGLYAKYGFSQVDGKLLMEIIKEGV
jgi:N-acetylglutamate synthase-like GNAT family acetyltransferase